MHHHTPLVGAALLTVCGALTAQNPLGITIGSGSTNSVARGFTDRTEETMTRVDASDYVGIGASTGGSITLTGMSFVVYDFERATPDPVHAVVRTEGSTPDFPDYANPPATRVGPLALAGTGGGGANFLVAFTTPVVLPAGQDFFLGTEYGAMTNVATNDGLWNYAVRGILTGTRYDLGGPALDTSSQTADTYASLYDLTNSAQFVYSKRYFLVDAFTNEAGGVCTAVTPQTSMPSSNAAPGIAGFYSGLHPDVNGLNDPARSDQPGYAFVDAAMAGQNVFVLLSGAGLNPTPTPLSSLVPGSTGTLCLNDGGVTAAALVADPTGAASVNLAIPAAVAPGLAGVALTWYGVAFDGNVLSGGPCGRQVF